MISVAHFVALVARLQVDLNASAVRRGIGAIHPNKGRKARNIRVLQNHSRQLLLPLRKSREGNVLRPLGNTHNHAGILHREKPFGHVHI